MNIALINKKTNICENIAIFESLDIAGDMFSNIYFVVETTDGFGINDSYVDGIWIKATPPDPENKPTIEEMAKTIVSMQEALNFLILDSITA